MMAMASPAVTESPQGVGRTDRHAEPSSSVADTDRVHGLGDPHHVAARHRRWTISLGQPAVFVGEGPLLPGAGGRLGMQHNVYRLAW